MSCEWKKVRLGDLVTIEHGYAFQGEYFNEEGEGDILLTPGNFAIGGGYQEKKLKFYDGPREPDYELSTSELLVTMTDLSKAADTLGYPLLLPERNDGKVYLHNQRIGRVLIHDQTQVDRRYLFYLLRTDEYRAEVLASATGSTVRHTAPSRIECFEFALPPLPEQKRIAQILGSLDDKIDLNRKMNRTLEAMARAIFKSWFIDFDPVHAKKRGEQPTGLNPETAALFPDRLTVFPLGPIPEGWEVKPIDEIGEFLNGTAVKKYRPDEGEPEFLPVIKIREMRGGFSEKSDSVTDEIPKRFRIENGDILFSWSGSLIVRIWTGGRGALNQHIFKVWSEEHPNWFVHQWTLHHLPFFRQIAASKATTMGHINRGHLTEAKCVVPPAELLQAADRIFKPLHQKFVLNDLENRSLARTRDTLLPELLSGENLLWRKEHTL